MTVGRSPSAIPPNGQVWRCQPSFCSCYVVPSVCAQTQGTINVLIVQFMSKHNSEHQKAKTKHHASLLPPLLTIAGHHNAICQTWLTILIAIKPVKPSNFSHQKPRNPNLSGPWLEPAIPWRTSPKESSFGPSVGGRSATWWNALRTGGTWL